MYDYNFVFDVNVLISAALSARSVPGLALKQAQAIGQVFVSSTIWAELEEVLARPRLEKYLSPDDRRRFLLALSQAVSFAEPTISLQVCRDPKDDRYLELAVSLQSACIVSGDRDLLVLNPFQGIQIMKPRDFLNLYPPQTN